MTVTEKREDPRVKRTRKLIQQALLELFAEKDIASISIQEIAERATVNRATFYAHFSDKHALIDSIVREGFQQTLTKHLATTSQWNIQSLRSLVRTTFDFLSEFHQHCEPSNRQFDPLMEKAVQEELAETVLTWLKQAKVAGKRPGVRVELVASAVSWAIFGPAIQWGRYERFPSAEEMTNQVMLILTEGLLHITPGFLPT